jgi:phosphatidylserine/phosphatidylglycerophosphate/cardiolipin synthase-like enzyme
MYQHAFFGRFANGAARAMGHPLAFVLAVLIILGWALTGPFFGFSDTWQLVINTGTTQGVSTMIDANHAISHNKVMVIDGELVLTGSFNFTKAAQEKNAENLLIIRDQALAAQYATNWDAHRQHSQPYVGRGVR